jgi:hypothetical protein
MTGSATRKPRLAGRDKGCNKKRTDSLPGGPDLWAGSVTFMRIGLPVVLFRSRKGGVPAGPRRDRESFPSFPAAAFGGAGYR